METQQLDKIRQEVFLNTGFDSEKISEEEFRLASYENQSFKTQSKLLNLEIRRLKSYKCVMDSDTKKMADRTIKNLQDQLSKLAY